MTEDKYYQICFQDVEIEADSEDEARDKFWTILKKEQALTWSVEEYTKKDLIELNMEIPE